MLLRGTGAISLKHPNQVSSMRLMNYLLDTNACVGILRNKPRCVRNHADEARADGSLLAISSIALHELWYGTYKSTRVEESVWDLRMFLAGGIKVLEFNEEDARIS